MNNNNILDDKLLENDEEKLFDQIEHLMKQFKFLYKTRMPLLLCPLNENSVAKFVCTTIKPTILKNKILLNYTETTEFVFDFINYKKLDKFNELPIRINSPKEILETRVGNSFEISTLLVSLLIGIGYDAYVVSGYASRELCNADLSFTQYSNSSLFQTKLESVEQESSVKKIEDKKCEQIEKVFESRYDESLAKITSDNNPILNREIEETLEPNVDQLAGLRVHSWVLCLAGKRGLTEPLFIETSSGEYKKIDEIKNYHGIESLWNNQNYWINFQDCSKGCNHLSFDLDEESKWEKVFFMAKYQEKGESLSLEFNRKSSLEKTKRQNIGNFLKSIWLPHSWVSNIDVNQSDILQIYPNSQKTLIYHKTIVSKYAPLTQKTNCILKVLKFEDVKMKKLTKTYYKYENRADFLDRRVFNHQKNVVTDFYNFGVTNGLHAHKYKANCKTKPGHERIMLFNSQLRTDCLIKRDETDLTIRETYLNRSDFLIFRSVLFKTPLNCSNLSTAYDGLFDDYKKLFSKKQFNKEKLTRQIELIVERYKRNPLVAIDDDFEEIIYNLKKSSIEIKYHRDNNHIIGTFHRFTKPVKFEDIKSGFDKFEFNSSLVRSYYAEPFKNNNLNHEKRLKKILLMLMEKEFDAIKHVRQIESENNQIFKKLANNEATNEIKNDIFGFIPSHAVSKSNLLIKNFELKNDFIEAYICDSTELKQKDLKQKCLNDFKNVYLSRINLLQNKYDQEMGLLKIEKSYYDLNRFNLNPDIELNILANLDKHVFNIDLLNKRIENIKKLAQNEFKSLEIKISTDDRFN